MNIEKWFEQGAYLFKTLPDKKYNAVPADSDGNGGSYHWSFNSPEKLSEWLTEHSEYTDGGVGIDLFRSPFIVVDVDNGAEGMKALADYLQTRVINPDSVIQETYTERTPSGGMHLIYRYDGELDGRSIVNKVELLHGNHGITIAPSVADGKPYTVVNDVEPAPAPEWALELLKQPEPVMTDMPVARKGKIHQLIAQLADGPLHDGERTAFFNSLTAYLLSSRGANLNAMQAYNFLIMLNNSPFVAVKYDENHIEKFVEYFAKREIQKRQQLNF